MKADEPLNPALKSGPPPAGLKFRLAEQKDFEALSALMAERNPSTPKDAVERSMQRELDTLKTDSNYKLFVAELEYAQSAESEIVGFCRFYDSAGLPSERKKYSFRLFASWLRAR